MYWALANSLSEKLEKPRSTSSFLLTAMLGNAKKRAGGASVDEAALHHGRVRSGSATTGPTARVGRAGGQEDGVGRPERVRCGRRRSGCASRSSGSSAPPQAGGCGAKSAPRAGGLATLPTAARRPGEASGRDRRGADRPGDLVEPQGSRPGVPALHEVEVVLGEVVGGGRDLGAAAADALARGAVEGEHVDRGHGAGVELVLAEDVDLRADERVGVRHAEHVDLHDHPVLVEADARVVGPDRGRPGPRRRGRPVLGRLGAGRTPRRAGRSRSLSAAGRRPRSTARRRAGRGRSAPAGRSTFPCR